MHNALPTVTVAGAPVEGPPHVCALFDNDADERAVLLPFVAETIAAGESLSVAIGADDRAAYVGQLLAAGLNVDVLLESRQLELLDTEAVYMPDGVFDPAKLVKRMLSRDAESRQLGFPRTRFIGHADWVLRKPRGVEALASFEARLTDVLGDNRQPAICVYRTDRIDPRPLVDAIRAHPSAVVGRSLWTNPVFPFFIPTDDRLGTLRPRGRKGDAT